MSKGNIYKNIKAFLTNITELTPENLIEIEKIFKSDIQTRQIFTALPEGIRTDPKIIELCIKYINPGSLKTTLNYITQATDMDSIEFLKRANQYHPSLVAKYLKRNRIEVIDLIELCKINPEIESMLVSCDLYTQDEKDKIYAFSSKWIKDGEPAQYLELSQNVRFSGREDYVRLAQAYIDEDSSLVKFCTKYQIDKSKFTKVLDMLASENKDLKVQIEQVKERASQRYMGLMAEIVDKVVAGETTIHEVLRTAEGRIDGWDLLNTYSYIDKRRHTQLLTQMVWEIEYGDGESKRDTIDKRYKLPRIGNTSMEQLSKWFGDEKEPLESVYNALGKIRGRLYFDKEVPGRTKFKAEELEATAKTYGGDTSISKILSLGSGFVHPETKKDVFLTEKNLQDAYTILKAHNKVPAHKLTLLLAKDIILGNIPESEITEAYQIVKTKELREKAKKERREKQMSKITTVDEYISYINNPTIELVNEQQQGDVQE